MLVGQAAGNTLQVGTLRDVASATDFFRSEAAGFVTCQALYVCGRLTTGDMTI